MARSGKSTAQNALRFAYIRRNETPGKPRVEKVPRQPLLLPALDRKSPVRSALRAEKATAKPPLGRCEGLPPALAPPGAAHRSPRRAVPVSLCLLPSGRHNLSRYLPGAPHCRGPQGAAYRRTQAGLWLMSTRSCLTTATRRPWVNSTSNCRCWRPFSYVGRRNRAVFLQLSGAVPLPCITAVRTHLRPRLGQIPQSRSHNRDLRGGEALAKRLTPLRSSGS